MFIKIIGKKGFITYKYKNKFIYSLYDPEAEAKKFIDSHKPFKPIIITCCGADYVNNELLKNDVKFVISFEPITFENSLSSNKLIRVKNIQEIENILLNGNIHANDISILIWQPLIESMPDIFLKQLNSLKEVLLKASFSSNTAKAFGNLETINFIINAFTLDEINILKVNNDKLNNPALVISSGPSLADNIDFINKVKDYSYVFSLPSSLPYLEKKGINPDFVIAVDPGYGTFYHLAKYKNLINLITPISIKPTIFRNPNLIPFIFNYGSTLEDVFFNDCNIVTSTPEGSVFINLLRILPLLGFRDAVLIGQDFGFKNNRSHINEGSFEREFLYWSGYYNSLEYNIKLMESSSKNIILDIEGFKIQSTTSLSLYYKHFINSTFNINLFIPKTCFNPLSNKIKKINHDLILEKYKKKTNIFDIIKTSEINNQFEKKEKIVNILTKIYKNNNLSEDIKKFSQNIFIDIENKNIMKKLKKYLRL